MFLGLSAKDKARFNLRLPLELKVDMEEYAQRHGTTITAIVISHFKQLLQAERESRQPIDAEQV